MEEYSNLESLNQIIGTVVKTKSDKMEVSGNGKLSEFPRTAGLQRMAASGNKNDCLIHSFLSATCPNFRKLSKTDKDDFADPFRREILPAILEDDRRNIVKRYKKNTRIIPFLKGRNFLENDHISMLCALYNVKILVFETIRIPRMDDQHAAQLYGTVYSRNRNTDDVYVIYNPGNDHFEPVRDKDNGNYTIPLREANRVAGNNAAELAGSSSSKASSNALNMFESFNPFNTNVRAVTAAQKKEEKEKEKKREEEIAANLIFFDKNPPAINRKALAKREGLPVSQFNGVTDAQIRQVFPFAGGARRRTRKA
jgi:hypothetical protein